MVHSCVKVEDILYSITSYFSNSKTIYISYTFFIFAVIIVEVELSCSSIGNINKGSTLICTLPRSNYGTVNDNYSWKFSSLLISIIKFLSKESHNVTFGEVLHLVIHTWKLQFIKILRYFNSTKFVYYRTKYLPSIIMNFTWTSA